MDPNADHDLLYGEPHPTCRCGVLDAPPADFAVPHDIEDRIIAEWACEPRTGNEGWGIRHLTS